MAVEDDPGLLGALRAAVGDAHVLTSGSPVDAVALERYELDWRRRCRGKALAVVRPGSTEEVAAVIRACAADGAAVVPQGGNTGLVAGGVPDASGTQVLLSLQRMERVRSIDEVNLTMTVEAGCVLQRVQEQAAARGLLFPLSLGAEGSCTIGGNLATNAGGTQVLRYGNARELCLGLEVVTACGEVLNGLSGLRKDNTGYDLRDLFIGSEGTLGIITAATLRLYPQPAAVVTALASCSLLEHCVTLLQVAQRRLGPALSGFEVMNAQSLRLVREHLPQVRQPLPAAPWTVLLEVSDTEGEDHARASLEALLGAALEQGIIDEAAVASTLRQSREMWHLRESITLAQAEAGFNIKHDIALPVSRIVDFCRQTDSELERRFPGVRRVNFGHLGDGNLHYNLQAPAQADSVAWVREHEPAVTTLVYAAVAEAGGSISAEHGIGATKLDALARHKCATALSLMRSLKAALDPQHLLNPGRLLPPLH